MDEKSLRKNLLRLAVEHPELRASVLPLLKSDSTSRHAQMVRQAHGPISMKRPDVMLFFIDREANNSKFYEMAVVPKGNETPAKTTKDFSRGLGNFVLMKRWGRLTDNGRSGRVDSMNELYADSAVAERAMHAWKQEKTRKGYKDVSRSREYPIGLGSAGFGWGGQAACTYVPELRGLSGQVGELLSSLRSMERVVGTLRDQNSGMVETLERHIGLLQQAADSMNKYLSGQLSSC